MLMNLLNLDENIRALMLEEIDFDIDRTKLYINHRLNLIGKRSYPLLLKDSAQSHDDLWLAHQMRLKQLLNATEPRKLKDRTIQVKVPDDANVVLAEDDFNRFYMRALCLYAINNKILSLKVF